MLYELLADVLAIAILVYILHEILNILLGRIYDSGIVAKLQHAQHRREYGVGEEEGQTLWKGMRSNQEVSNARLDQLKGGIQDIWLGLCGFFKRFANECAPEIKYYSYYTNTVDTFEAN